MGKQAKMTCHPSTNIGGWCFGATGTVSTSQASMSPVIFLNTPRISDGPFNSINSKFLTSSHFMLDSNAFVMMGNHSAGSSIIIILFDVQSQSQRNFHVHM